MEKARQRKQSQPRARADDDDADAVLRIVEDEEVKPEGEPEAPEYGKSRVKLNLDSNHSIAGNNSAMCVTTTVTVNNREISSSHLTLGGENQQEVEEAEEEAEGRNLGKSSRKTSLDSRPIFNRNDGMVNATDETSNNDAFNPPYLL